MHKGVLRITHCYFSDMAFYLKRHRGGSVEARSVRKGGRCWLPDGVNWAVRVASAGRGCRETGEEGGGTEKTRLAVTKQKRAVEYSVGSTANRTVTSRRGAGWVLGTAGGALCRVGMWRPHHCVIHPKLTPSHMLRLISNVTSSRKPTLMLLTHGNNCGVLRMHLLKGFFIMPHMLIF